MPTETGASSLQRDYVTGPLAPVTDELTVTDLDVTGSLPVELCGRYVRNGPNPLDPDPATQHWFLGTGMLHGVRLEDGRAAWYRNRFVRNTIDEGGSPNTNVVSMGGRTWAIVEAGGAPVEVTDELESIASNRFDGTLEGAYTAHPHRDPRTGTWHAITYHWAEEAVRYVVNDGARVVHEEIVPVGGRPMVHDTAITPTSVLLFDLPCTFDLDEAMAGTPFPYRWDPERDARVGVLPLLGTADQIRWVEVPRCYVFHPLNAVDLPDGRVAVDLVVWPRMFDRDRLGPNEGAPRLERWTLDPVSGTSSIEVVDDRSQEFPRGDERRTGEELRYGMTVGGRIAGGVHQPLLWHDLTAGTTVEVDFGQTSAAQEFVHVPRSGSVAEDDAWLLGFVSDRAEGTTDLVVLAADDPATGPIARVHLPQRVPDGFHGNWLPDPV
ncbi:carotenoid oxygenase family protein [Dermatobacter hominis]|uniref:carotenoid oxygenase family protein n=1 Tax=Dermatobacter hominis TaxID=2884263 RepID=UPI001D0F5695|nr:carotenoid oxygenase family protein [Dermatobacter hominis]UDY34715.1 carotenoid oxygenase family protein [Dermatobacter hominis]